LKLNGTLETERKPMLQDSSYIPVINDLLPVKLLLRSTLSAFRVNTDYMMSAFFPNGRSAFSVITLKEPPIDLSYQSFISYFEKGKDIIRRGLFNERQKFIIDLLTAVINMDIAVDEFNTVYYFLDGKAFTSTQVSASINGISTLLIPLLSLETPSLVFIEEPEEHLHPSYQVLLAMAFSALAKVGYKFIISTHSDLFAIALAQLVVQKPNKEQILELIKGIDFSSKGMDNVVSAVTDTLANLNVKVYEFDGITKPFDTKLLLSERVPSMTETIDVLTNWAFKLATIKAQSEENASQK